MIAVVLLVLITVEVCLFIALVDETYEVGIRVVVLVGMTVGRTSSYPYTFINVQQLPLPTAKSFPLVNAVRLTSNERLKRGKDGAIIQSIPKELYTNVLVIEQSIDTFRLS